MMRQKTKFPFAFHPDLNLQVTSMFFSIGFFGRRRASAAGVQKFKFNRLRFTLEKLIPSPTYFFPQILELPYQGSDLSMIIMLPTEIEDDTTGLEKVGHFQT